MHAEIRIIVAGRFTLQGIRRAFRSASRGFCMQDVHSSEGSAEAASWLAGYSTGLTHLMPAAQLEITLIGASSVSSTMVDEETLAVGARNVAVPRVGDIRVHVEQKFRLDALRWPALGNSHSVEPPVVADKNSSRESARHMGWRPPNREMRVLPFPLRQKRVHVDLVILPVSPEAYASHLPSGDTCGSTSAVAVATIARGDACPLVGG